MLPNNYIGLFILLILSISSCKNRTVPIKETKIEEPVSIVNSWNVSAIPKNSLYTPTTNQSTGSRPHRITFLEDNSIEFVLSINTCQSTYTLKDSTITFQGSLICTEACCDSNEDIFLQGLYYGSLKYSIQGKRLTIQTEEGPIEFTLAAE